MDGVIGMEEARAIVGNAALWPRVRDFLWDFAGQVHESWLEGIAGAETSDAEHVDVSSLVSRLATVPRVKRFILAQLEVAPCFHAFPKDDGSRLLLLDGATLEGVARWLGAIACAEELRRITDGATIRALKAALPGVYPDVFGYVAYFSKNDFERRDAEALGIEEIQTCGIGVLLSAVANLPASLYLRFRMKLPKQLCGLCDSASLRLKERPTPTALSAVLKLLKLKFPEAYSLCCS